MRKIFSVAASVGFGFSCFACRGISNSLGTTSRDAGPVKWPYRDASGPNGYDAVLHSQNF